MSLINQAWSKLNDAILRVEGIEAQGATPKQVEWFFNDLHEARRLLRLVRKGGAA